VHLKARIDGVAPILGPGEGRQRNGRKALGRIAAGAQGPHQLISVALGHADIAYQYMRCRLAHLRHCFIGTGRFTDPRTRVGQKTHDQRARIHIVLDHQNVDAREQRRFLHGQFANGFAKIIFRSRFKSVIAV